MKTLFSCLTAFACLSLLGGCATTTTPRPSAPPMIAPPVDPALHYGAPVVPPVAAVPPARPVAAMPPGNWAWLHTPPYGCETGPLALQIWNSTEYYVAVQMDGEDLMIRGAYGVLPSFIPPGASVYVCLTHTNIHSIAGTAFINRAGTLQEVDGASGRFLWQGSFGTAVNGNIGRHGLTIDHTLFAFN